MGMKTFLKRLAAAFGDAAVEELDKSNLSVPPLDPFNERSPQTRGVRSPYEADDDNDFPVGYHNLGIDEEP